MTTERRGPWVRHASETRLSLEWFSVHEDRVTTPGGRTSAYQWVNTRDVVRVAALTETGAIYLVRQHHYLPDRVMWQLPGGQVDAAEQPLDAAARELAEEVGARASKWRSCGSVWPMPGLTTARAHLWLAEDLTTGRASLEHGEADLTAETVPLERAVQHALDGGIGCSASAQLILILWATRQPPASGQARPST